MEDYLTDAFLRIREKLMGRSRRILRDASAAEDALQEAFVKLWGRYQIHSSKEAEALLNRTVRNASIDAFRQRRSVPINGTDVPDEGMEATLDKERLFRKIEALVESDLTDTQKYIIRRHEYEGAKLQTVARELGMNPPAVRMQLSRARKTIRDRYYENKLL
ncbi:MAG: sigma-70 family RNA polymerase sigma factor [Bacteroidales bacterium]|nr:sigma-70 family RNA polymerase sigma factor [Bacteroidales bacterium]